MVASAVLAGELISNLVEEVLVVELSDEAADEDQSMSCSNSVVLWIFDGTDQHCVELLALPFSQLAKQFSQRFGLPLMLFLLAAQQVVEHEEPQGYSQVLSLLHLLDRLVQLMQQRDDVIHIPFPQQINWL